MMGVVTNESLLEGTVLVELPRFALLDLELVGSMPEDGTCMFPMTDHQLFLYHDVATIDLIQHLHVYCIYIHANY